MKNHIKNYIKIMGLAAVPFGTAQAEDFEIKVTQEYKCDPNDPGVIRGSTIFDISVSKNGGKPCECHIISRISSCWYICLSSSLKGYASYTPIYQYEDVEMFDANTYMSPISGWDGRGRTIPRFIFVPCSGVVFLIVVDPLRKYGGSVYNLIIKADDESSNFYISSDVPTMGCGKMRSYCSDNEIVDTLVRREFIGYRNKLTTLFFVYCENAVWNLNDIVHESDCSVSARVVARYNVAREKVDIYFCSNKGVKFLKTVEDVPTLREALWHSEYEAGNNKELPAGIRKKAQVGKGYDEVKAKYKIEEPKIAKKEGKVGEGKKLGNKNQEDGKDEIKNEIKEEKKSKKQEEDKKEAKKSEKDPFEIKKDEEKKKEDPFGEK